jgi:Lon protease-like protein
MARCARCHGEVEERFRFCPWCAEPLRTKIVEFFAPHPRDAGKALRVSRYLTDEPHVRFSVWDESGVAEAAVSVDDREAERLARFLRPRPAQGTLQRSAFGRWIAGAAIRPGARKPRA